MLRKQERPAPANGRARVSQEDGLPRVSRCGACRRRSCACHHRSSEWSSCSHLLSDLMIGDQFTLLREGPPLAPRLARHRPLREPDQTATARISASAAVTGIPMAPVQAYSGHGGRESLGRIIPLRFSGPRAVVLRPRCMLPPPPTALGACAWLSGSIVAARDRRSRHVTAPLPQPGPVAPPRA
jgi:hypothetical protein